MSLVTSLPIIGGAFDSSGEDALNQLKQNQRLLQGIQTPELTWKDYAPEMYSNESANYQLTNEDPLVRSAQMSYLNKMSGLADQGLTDVDQAGYQQARNQGAQLAKGGTDAAIANAQARGVGGSGMEFAMREMANQQGAQRAQDMGLQQAADSAKQRALYEQAYGNALTGVRGQDFQANKANSDVINQFNMTNTQARNQVNNQNVGMRNQAQQMNNQGKNDVSQQNFNNQMSRATGQMNANKDVAGGYAAQNAANTADRNMWTQLAAQGAMAAYGGGKKPAGT